MKKILLQATAFTLLITLFSFSLAAQQQADTLCYEMRVYHTFPGKMPDLLNRFRSNTMRIFEKHGMTNVGYFQPIHNPDSALIYFLSYPGRSARDAAWKAFSADPEWQAVARKSEENGKIVQQVDSYFLTTTDFSPRLRVSQAGKRVFELRLYETTPYNLGLLLARFRNHSTKLFAKQGMENLVYWTQPGNDHSLIYLLGHRDEAAAKAAFAAFRADPDWRAVRQASELLGGGSLTVSVRSILLKPTDFSPWK